MKHFTAAVLVTLSLASQASAFSLDISLPNLTFPETSTSVSTENCAPTAVHPCK